MASIAYTHTHWTFSDCKQKHAETSKLWQSRALIFKKSLRSPLKLCHIKTHPSTIITITTTPTNNELYGNDNHDNKMPNKTRSQIEMVYNLAIICGISNTFTSFKLVLFISKDFQITFLFFHSLAHKPNVFCMLQLTSFDVSIGRKLTFQTKHNKNTKPTKKRQTNELQKNNSKFLIETNIENATHRIWLLFDSLSLIVFWVSFRCFFFRVDCNDGFIYKKNVKRFNYRVFCLFICLNK